VLAILQKAVRVAEGEAEPETEPEPGREPGATAFSAGVTGEERPLLNRDFVLLEQGQFVSLLGSELFMVAALFWLKHETGSAAMLGLLGVAGSVPALILGPIAGALADRWSRRAIVIWCDVLRGLGSIALALLVFAAPEQEGWVLAGIFAQVILVSILGSIFGPTILATLPDLVPRRRLSSGNSIHMALSRSARLLGPGVGGVAFRFLGAPFLFLLNGVSYLVSAFSEGFIRFPRRRDRSREAGGQTSVKDDLAEGLRYIWRWPGLRSFMIAVGVINFMVTPLMVLLPFYVEDTLGANVEWYGFLMTAFGVGSLAAYLMLAAVRISARGKGVLMTASLFGLALSAALLAWVRTPVAALACYSAVGACAGAFGVSSQTILQHSTPSELRGRVFAVLGTMSQALTPLAMAAAGFAADLSGQNVPLIYLVCGAGVAAASLTATLDPNFRGFLSYDPTPETSSSRGDP
jgi:MFS family permease